MVWSPTILMFLPHITSAQWLPTPAILDSHCKGPFLEDVLETAHPPRELLMEWHLRAWVGSGHVTYVVIVYGYVTTYSVSKYYVVMWPVLIMLVMCDHTHTAIMCSSLTAPVNGMISYAPDMTAPFAYQTTATYSCNSGFAPTGGDTVRTCEQSQADGVWSGFAPTCQG